MGKRERKHLRRLGEIFDTGRSPLFFLTCCTRDREAVLADGTIAEVLADGWRDAVTVHGWMVGRYVVMPDHVHFFAAPCGQKGKDLSRFVGSWKRWTRSEIRRVASPSFGWQREFFDHLMRKTESYAEKWEYVRANPVRAELVGRVDEWPYQGEIRVLEW